MRELPGVVDAAFRSQSRLAATPVFGWIDARVHGFSRGAWYDRGLRHSWRGSVLYVAKFAGPMRNVWTTWLCARQTVTCEQDARQVPRRRLSAADRGSASIKCETYTGR